MLRSFIAILLLPSLTVQTVVPGAGAFPATVSPSEESPKALSYRSFNQLRRGTEEKVAIVVEGAGFLTSPRSPEPGVIPLTFELQPAEGFTFEAIDYPKPYKHKFAFRHERIAVFQFPWQQLEFTLRAAPNLTLGVHALTGRLTFQIVGDGGVSALQQVDVRIPITVVERNARVDRSHYYPRQDRVPPWNDMPLATKLVLVPALPVLFLLSGLVCVARGEDCRC